MSDYTYLSPEEFVALLDDPLTREQVSTIDCRDTDREEGFIVGSIHAPAIVYTPAMYTELAKRLFEGGCVHAVFHCALSQVRGPKGAGRFVAAQRLAGYPLPNVYVLRGGWELFHATYRSTRPDLYYAP